MLQKRIFSIVPVGVKCNLRCTYCYHHALQCSGSEKEVMPDHVLKKVIEATVNSADTVEYVWHGGEPLLAGICFYEKAVSWQNQFRIKTTKIENHIQSNFTLLNEGWVAWLKNNDFYISTSVDGPKELHDKYRRHPSGLGTFDEIMTKIDLCDKHKLAYGVVTVVNNENVNYPDEVFLAMKDIAKWGFDLNICTQRFGGLNLVPPNDKLINFYKRIFDLWYQHDSPNLPIRTFVGIIQRLLNGHPSDCTFASHGCKVMLAVDCNGDLYPCGRFLRVPEMYLGNIIADNFDDILSRPKNTIKQLSSIPKGCSSCKWIDTCGGGCRFERWLANKNPEDSFPWCDFRKQLFKHILSSLLPTIQQMKEKNEKICRVI